MHSKAKRTLSQVQGRSTSRSKDRPLAIASARQRKAVTEAVRKAEEWKRRSAFWGYNLCELARHSLAVARKQSASEEILLWMTPSEAPKALQASECSELLNPMRAICWIAAQHQPGTFTDGEGGSCAGCNFPDP